MKVLFGMALRQTKVFMESLLRVIGLDWDSPNFSTLIRQRTRPDWRDQDIGPQRPIGQGDGSAEGAKEAKEAKLKEHRQIGNGHPGNRSGKLAPSMGSVAQIS